MYVPGRFTDKALEECVAMPWDYVPDRQDGDDISFSI
jgi:hypothetical protein